MEGLDFRQLRLQFKRRKFISSVCIGRKVKIGILVISMMQQIIRFVVKLHPIICIILRPRIGFLRCSQQLRILFCCVILWNARYRNIFIASGWVLRLWSWRMRSQQSPSVYWRADLFLPAERGILHISSIVI